MNKNDSDLIASAFEREGLFSTTLSEADIVIYNTCSVRKNAEKRAIARLRESKAHKRGKGIVIAAGCLSQHKGKELLQAGICDIVVGPYESPALPSIIKGFFDDTTKNMYVSSIRNDFLGRLHPTLAERPEKDFWHKFVTITHGCENFCTYCIVPYVRGPLISFSSREILDYIVTLPAYGVFEVTLLGQNVNQYGQDNNDISFAKLLSMVAQIKGIQKINFLTSHPKDFTEELVDVMKSFPTIARSIHLPLQSGSNTILQKMNRGYNIEHYLQSIDLIRKAGDYSITTDLIVGFPGETPAEHNESMQTIQNISFDDAYMYAYSPREGTKSAEYPNQLSKKLKGDRLQELINMQRTITIQSLNYQIGKQEKIIVERVSKKNDNEVVGKTFRNQQVIIAGNYTDIGKIFKIEITKVHGATLVGKKV